MDIIGESLSVESGSDNLIMPFQQIKFPLVNRGKFCDVSLAVSIGLPSKENIGNISLPNKVI